VGHRIKNVEIDTKNKKVNNWKMYIIVADSDLL